ncbi:maleylacetoacetate isomerase [Simiduia aestuariiviva]|uniref:Maleylacetoacetate isomerase n=1 Tax=Simiduia aestuariiviva TaxID=1510459 RepID=A0A839UP91_9GAMM|nr:maleylacetoacetate isomerase [Simiduia aestuariiviva]MBB3167576.1 maleylacetoacetate isomerase [Simiduia aestuariiviva]
MKLYGYFRSSAAYRVRIALNLKGIAAEQVPVSLIKGEQQQATYTALNPQGLVPALATEQGLLTQSLAIIEYLESQHPTPALLPGDAWQQAQIRAFALALACDIHPLNNLRVLKYLTGDLALEDTQKNQWYAHWIQTGFAALESQLTQTAGAFCFGDSPTLADVCLVPQVYNAKRFNVDLSAFPKVQAIAEHCNTLPAFIDASPEQQPDAPK